MKRRDWGTGSIYPQVRDGQRTGRVFASIELRDGGMRRRRRRLFDSEAEARRWLREQKNSVSSAATVTLGAYLERWLRDVVIHERRPRTVDGYRAIVEREIVPAMGRIPLARVTALDVTRFRNAQAERFRPGTVRNHVYCLRAALSAAVRMNLIAANPAASVQVAAPHRSVPEPWTLEQARTFLAHVQGDPLEPLYLLALTTGMRQGELLGLRWSDVDWTSGTLTVNRTLVRLGRRFVAGEPKTPLSHRSLTLAPAALEALRVHRHASTLVRTVEDQGLVFARAKGSPLANWWVTREFQRLSAEAGLPVIRFHDLRHTAATLLFAAGVEPKVIQDMLGHSTVATTLDIYAAMTDERRREGTARLGEMLEMTR